MRGKLVDAQLLDNLKQVNFLVKFLLRLTEQEIDPLILVSAATAPVGLEPAHARKSLERVTEGLPRIYFLGKLLVIGVSIPSDNPRVVLVVSIVIIIFITVISLRIELLDH